MHQIDPHSAAEASRLHQIAAQITDTGLQSLRPEDLAFLAGEAQLALRAVRPPLNHTEVQDDR